MNVLALNPFDGGSHRQFLAQVQQHSRWDWRILADKPVHWKWRMRYAPLGLVHETRQVLDQIGRPDVVFCTDMLDLPAWKGLCDDPRLVGVPVVAYFHENQFTYPIQSGAREDFHFAYTNLLTAYAADACVFNSEFHRTDFLSESKAFLARVPDGRKHHDLNAIEAKSQVIHPGIDPPDDSIECQPRQRIRIGWVSRWEHDKRPDRFLEVLRRLNGHGLNFQLILLGPRPPSDDPSLRAIRDCFGEQIVQDGHLASRSSYWKWLGQMDVVFSAADHEFYGMAVCEAVWAGATPVLPNRLSYPELFGEEVTYASLDEAVELILAVASEGMDVGRRLETREQNRCQLRRHLAVTCVDQIDGLLETLHSTPFPEAVSRRSSAEEAKS